MLARHVGCRCDLPGGTVCAQQRADPVRTCATLSGKWLYPPVANSKEAEELELEFQRGEGEQLSDDEDEVADETAEEHEVDNAPIGQLRPLTAETRADEANRATKRAKTAAAALEA